MHWLLILATDGTPTVQFDASSIMAALSTVGSVGFAVWYAWYVTTVSIPKLLEAHRAERAEMQARFDATMHELLAEMKEQRTSYAAWKDK
jgi:hypothetical protein